MLRHSALAVAALALSAEVFAQKTMGPLDPEYKYKVRA